MRSILRKPTPRLLCPSKISDIGRPFPFAEGEISEHSLSSIFASISSLCRNDFARDLSSAVEGRETLFLKGEPESDGPLMIFDRIRKMDPVVLAKIVSEFTNRKGGEGVGNDDLAKLIIVATGRLEEFPLGALSRVLFKLSLRARDGSLTPDLRGKIYARAVPRVLELVSEKDVIPGNVLSKLCVSLSLLSEGAREERVWSELERLTMNGVENLEASQVQQVCFGFSRMRSLPGDLSVALTRRGVEVSPLSCIQTYMSLLISLSRVQFLASEGREEWWTLFKKIARDQLGLREGFIPLPELRRRLEGFPDATLRRVRHSFTVS